MLFFSLPFKLLWYRTLYLKQSIYPKPWYIEHWIQHFSRWDRDGDRGPELGPFLPHSSHSGTHPGYLGQLTLFKKRQISGQFLVCSWMYYSLEELSSFPRVPQSLGGSRFHHSASQVWQSVGELGLDVLLHKMGASACLPHGGRGRIKWANPFSLSLSNE